MINILYDNQIFKIQKFGGISRYYAELIKGVNRTRNYKAVPEKFFSANKHLRSNGLTRFNRFTDDFNFRGKWKVEDLILRNEQKKLIKMLRSGDFDIYHPTYYDPALVKCMTTSRPFVMTVYDMIHELYYDPLYENVHAETKYKRYMLPKASHIIAISQNTKNDILRFFPEIDESKISVVYLGSSLSAGIEKTNIVLPSRYLLFVGNRGKYKNFLWLLNSIEPLLKSYNLTLICGGGGTFTEYEQSIINKLNLSDKVSHVPVNNDNDLVTLYNKAVCFIFPSLYEGFGIPILEAFSCSCPVVLPDTSCFPEIAGNAALYYNKNNPEALVEQLEKILDDHELAKSLNEAGLRRLQFFCWDKTVSQHIEIYNSISSS